MSSRVSLAIVVLVVALCGAGCTRIVAKPGATSLENFSLTCPRDRVFDQALSFAQERNLEVKVLEKSSGLIRFERSSLSALDLDRYCIFPLVNSKTNMPVGTFESWGAEYEGTSVGTVNLNLLLSENGSANTNVSLRGNWSVQLVGDRWDQVIQVSSNGTLEDELKAYLEERQSCAEQRSSTGAQKLEQLRRLRNKGLITPAEFQRKQKQLSGD